MKLNDYPKSEPKESTYSIDDIIGYTSSYLHKSVKGEGYTLDVLLCLANEIKRLKGKVSELESKIEQINPKLS